MSTILDISIDKRIKLIRQYGGLPRPEIINQEWLYMLKEETRNSILIEGVFISDEELEEILLKGKSSGIKRNQQEALNYYKVAKNFYNLAYEASKEGGFTIRNFDIKNINCFLFDSIDNKVDKGSLRKGDIKITGAKIVPPSEFYVRDWLEFYVEYVNENIENKLDYLDFIARQHILFESIHPFDDGNGRTGRIITNSLLLYKNYPLVIINGEENNKNLYYEALEEGDKNLRELTGGYDGDKIKKAIAEMKVDKMINLIKESLKDNFDRLLIKLMGYYDKLQTINSISEQIRYNSNTIRTMMNRGQFIAIKRGNRWHSHKNLLIMNILTLEELKSIISSLKEKNISESKFAEAIGYSRQYVNEVKQGKKPITEDFSKKVLNYTDQN